MIFLLDCDVDGLHALEESEAGDLFSELLLSAIRGNHLVLIPRKLCRWAEENLTFNNRETEKLNQIRETYSTTAGILSEASTFLRIVLGNQNIGKRDDNSFVVGHTHFLSSKYGEEPSSLLTENQRYDGEFYELVFNKVRKILGIPTISMKLKHGGGGTTPARLEANIDERHISVCIFDTDKTSPDSNKSKTCLDILKIIGLQTGGFVGGGFETPVAEAENFIPLGTYIKISKLTSLNASVTLQRAADTNFWKYFDIKEGFVGSTFIENHEHSDIEWLKGTLSYTLEQIRGLSFPSISQDALSLFLACNVARKDFDQVCKSTRWQEMFLDFFKDVIWFFCSDKKLRAR